MDVVELAKQIATLGVSGVLAYIYLQWQGGKIHSDSEVQQIRQDDAEDRAYRESLRKEAVEDRKASDAKVVALTNAIAELTEIVKRSLEFNERLVEDSVRPRRIRE